MANRKLKTRIEELERRQPAARACVSTQFDKDALELYPIQFELHGKTYPDYSVFEQTSIAIRGRELVYQICGPIVPAHKDPKWNQRTSASREFKWCFQREPVEGDLLRCEHVRMMRGPEVNDIEFNAQIEAWRRQLPQLPCPLKFEDGRLFKRQRNGEWLEAVEVSWKAHWWGVECDARGTPEAWAYGRSPEFWSEPDPDPLGRMPSISAVTFLGLIDGKMACRPATDEEQRGPEEDEFFREIFCSEPTSAPPPGHSWVRNLRNGFYGSLPMEDLAAATRGPNPDYTVYNWSPRKRSTKPSG